jgi:P2-related tail formation protein
LIEQAETNGEKVNNYELARQVGIEVEQSNTDEEWNVVYKRRVVSVAVSRKKKVAVGAIKSVVKGVFPS